jgi:hypothetical protein
VDADLACHPADLRRLGARSRVVDRRQRQQAADLARIITLAGSLPEPAAPWSSRSAIAMAELLVPTSYESRTLGVAEALRVAVIRRWYYGSSAPSRINNALQRRTPSRMITQQAGVGSSKLPPSAPPTRASPQADARGTRSLWELAALLMRTE